MGGVGMQGCGTYCAVILASSMGAPKVLASLECLGNQD